MQSHQLIDRRSLAFGRAVAEHVRRRPELIDEARARIGRWMTSVSPGTKPALLEWLAAMDEGPKAVLALLTSEDERAIRLRQSNPFAGVLSNQERNAILREYQAYDSNGA